MNLALHLYRRLRNRLRRDNPLAEPPRDLIGGFFSLKSLLALGFLVTMIPVFIALSHAGLGMRQTAGLGESALRETAEQMKVMRVALQRVNDIERKARLFVLLSDPALRQPYERASYENVRDAFRQSLNDLLRQPGLDNKLTLRVNELLEKERLIHEQIIGSDSGEAPKLPVEEAFQGLRDAANGLWQEITGRVDAQGEALHREARALELDLFIRTAGLMTVSVGFFLVFLRVLNRSIRQLDQSVRRLGAGRFGEPIAVSGPRDLRRLGERLEWLRTRLLDLEEAKQAFMQNVSKEIETPLQAMLEDADDLDRELADSGITGTPEAVLKLRAQAGRLRSVSDELLRYSQISENPILGQSEVLDLKALLDGVIADYRDRLRAKGLKLRALTQQVSYHGIADPLCGIFGQLIDNAVKFSPEQGEIRVILRSTGDAVEFEVEDDGPGIDADERERVLKPFFRGKAGLALGGEGAGLGLAIASEYLAHCQGRIEFLEPRQDHHGARIRVRIPLLEAP